MTSYAMPETISAESFEALESSIKEHFCAKCIDRDCEKCSVHRFLQRTREKVK